MMRSARPGRRVPALFVLAALAVTLLVPAAAFGISATDTKVTVDQTTGGQATRFTFETLTSQGAVLSPSTSKGNF